MGVKRPQVGDEQRFLSFEGPSSLRHGASGEGGTQAAACEALQASTALDPARALTEHLMEETCQRENLNRAYRRVKSNRGAPGTDGMTVAELGVHLKEHWPRIREQLLNDLYQPRPVKRVEIPKSGRDA